MHRHPVLSAVGLSRRAALGRTGAIAAALVLGGPSFRAAAQEASPAADNALPLLEITLTDTSFEFTAPLAAGRQRVLVTNAGTLTDSHFALGRIPDRITETQYDEWYTSLARTDGTGGQIDGFTFDDIEFVGVPDWPQPDRDHSGIVDIAPGRYFLFDPFSGRQDQRLTVAGEPIAPDAPEPTSDLTVTLREMEIVLPDAALTTAPVRWKVENTGAISHEVALVPVSADFTDEDLQLLFSLPEDATPEPGTPELVYQPAAAIGILARGHTSWLDVELKQGRYLAACFLPFGTGYPHAIDGMYRFIDIA